MSSSAPSIPKLTELKKIAPKKADKNAEAFRKAAKGYDELAAAVKAVQFERAALKAVQKDYAAGFTDVAKYARNVATALESKQQRRATLSMRTLKSVSAKQKATQKRVDKLCHPR